ncbi:MAG: hypothetical protein KFF73_15040 [Cyclobacteriaceae bacterium]|nr:hypothetical protein [Cyclobacteriaceae bacterium]
METAQEFLSKKGFRKVHQINKRYNLTIGELVEFLNEYAHKALKNGSAFIDKNKKPGGIAIEHEIEKGSRISQHVNS